MKKMIVVIIVFLIILSGFNLETNFSLLNYFSGDYLVYTSNENGENCVDLGFCYMNSKPVSECVVGESMVIKNFEIGSALDALNARVVKTEYFEDGTTVIYAFTNLIDDIVQVAGQRVNLQIATKDDRSVIGWPLILGSY